MLHEKQQLTNNNFEVVHIFNNAVLCRSIETQQLQQIKQMPMHVHIHKYMFPFAETKTNT